MSPTVIGILAGLVVVALPSLLIFRPSEKRQIDVLDGIIDVDQVMEDSRKARQLGRGARFAKDHPDVFERLLKLTGINIEKIRKEVYRSGSSSINAEDIAVTQLVVLLGGAGLFICVILIHAPLPILAMIGLAMLLGFILPRNRITALIRQRETEFTKNFPDFLDSLEIPLRNGLPQLRVFERVSEKFPGVVGEEFRRVVIESKAQGDRLQVPLEDLVERIHTPVVSDFVSAFLTAQRTGTDLGTVIANMSRTIRITATQEQEEANRKKINPIMMITLVFYMLPYLLVTVAPLLINAFSSLSGAGI